MVTPYLELEAILNLSFNRKISTITTWYLFLLFLDLLTIVLATIVLLKLYVTFAWKSTQHILYSSHSSPANIFSRFIWYTGNKHIKTCIVLFGKKCFIPVQMKRRMVKLFTLILHYTSIIWFYMKSFWSPNVVIGTALYLHFRLFNNVNMKA